jgi:formate dehydrogenase alpha subunit
MSYPLEYGSAKEILKEIRSLIPGYAVLGAGPTPPRPDQAAVDRYLREGYAKDLDARYVPAGGAGAKEKEFTFILAQSLFHSGKLSTYAKGLLKVQDSGSVALNPIDAERLEVVTGDRVRIFNPQGDMTTVAKVLDHVPQGLAVFPEHFDREAHKLMTVSTDAVTGTPYCKMARVSIERV